MTAQLDDDTLNLIMSHMTLDDAFSSSPRSLPTSPRAAREIVAASRAAEAITRPLSARTVAMLQARARTRATDEEEMLPGSGTAVPMQLLHSMPTTSSPSSTRSSRAEAHSRRFWSGAENRFFA